MARQVTDITALQHMIIHVLSVYPRVSPSMLQTGLGPHNRRSHWQPALDKLIEDRLVKIEEVWALTSFGQKRSYTVISLADNKQVEEQQEERG